MRITNIDRILIKVDTDVNKELLRSKIVIIKVMAEESDDGFNPSQIEKKPALSGLGIDSDTEDVLKEFNFLTQPAEVFRFSLIELLYLRCHPACIHCAVNSYKPWMIPTGFGPIEAFSF